MLYKYCRFDKGIVMFQRKICASLVLILGLAAAPAFAQQAEHEQHHPPGMPAAAEADEGMPAGGMPGMAGMMRMMMGQSGMGGMGMMTGHVEGRLAFLKTELKITDAQLPLWNAVADAIRTNAKHHERDDAGRHDGERADRHAAGEAGVAGKDDDGASRRAAPIQGSGRSALCGAQPRTEENRRPAADGSDGHDVARNYPNGEQP